MNAKGNFRRTSDMIKPGSSPLPLFPSAAPTSMASAMKPSPAMISKHLWKRPNPMKSSAKRNRHWFYKPMTSLPDMVMAGGNLSSGCLGDIPHWSAASSVGSPKSNWPCLRWVAKMSAMLFSSIPVKQWSQWLKGCDRPIVPNALLLLEDGEPINSFQGISCRFLMQLLISTYFWN